jgi:hypothetical protein
MVGINTMACSIYIGSQSEIVNRIKKALFSFEAVREKLDD